jgi:hypothetical protein
MDSLKEGFRRQFADNVDRLLQQESSQLRPLVRNESLQHEIEYFDTIMSSEAYSRAKTDDGYDIDEAVQTNDPTIKRRVIAACQIAWQMRFDSGDQLNTLIEPRSFQNKDAAWALGREYDRTILRALVAKVKGGQTGGTDIYLPLASQIVPLGVGLTAGTNALIAANQADPILGGVEGYAVNAIPLPIKEKYGSLTLAKLLKAREILRKNMYGSREKMYFICSSN